LDQVTTDSVVGTGPSGTVGVGAVEFRDRFSLTAGPSYTFTGDGNELGYFPFGTGLAMTYHQPDSAYNTIELHALVPDADDTSKLVLGPTLAGNLVGNHMAPTGTGKIAFVTSASQAGQITYASAPGTITPVADLPQRYRQISDLAMSQGKILATFQDLDTGVWTHSAVPGSWSDTYPTTALLQNGDKDILVGADVVATVHNDSVRVSWPGGGRTPLGYSTDVRLSNDGKYLERSASPGSYRVENARTGAVVKTWSGTSWRLLDDGRAWTGPDSAGKLVGYDLTGTRADRVVTIARPCATPESDELFGRWLVLGCANTVYAIDLLKKLPTRGISNYYTWRLGAGFLAWTQNQTGNPKQVQVMNLATGETRSYGPSRAGTYAGPRLAADRSGKPLMAYADPTGQARVVDLSSWVNQPWSAGGPSPINVTAARGDKVALISWTAPTKRDTPIDSYTVTSHPDGRTVTVPASTTSAKLTGLVLGRSYTFTVTAHDGAGTGAASRASNAVVFAGKPGTPIASTSVSGRTAVIRWRAPAANGSPITKYVVHLNSRSVTVSNAARSYAFRSLPHGTYRISVTAVNAVGAGPTHWYSVRI
ncbi:MAG: fibronectin type III domain-containing protein, partial [Marmoricola sp.]